ncbi:sortase [Nocardioides daeguensis]|uniref:Sortase n=1 Tax=Nocardioides daeguensis TaxID=908359 RepID=A0ABP6W9I2_9ACTN|nr:sortase [Nocardioides daeguensis]MBV6729328.1 sortase [Nocardioides daeguensis]MCR1774304.1 sortase [Nocardioides daeguensis]
MTTTVPDAAPTVAATAPAPASAEETGRRRRTPPPPPPPSESGMVVNATLTVVALLCLWLVVHLLFLGAVSHDRAQSLLHSELRSQLAGATAPVGPVTEPGAPVALLSIPAIGVEETVVEGTAAGDLFAGPGHRRDTVLPGQVGASTLYGRSTTYGAPFRDLDRLAAGDLIKVTMAQGKVTFRVLGLRHDGDPLPQPAAQGAARLTLVTAAGEGRFARMMPGSTVYVDAEAAQGFPAPAGLSPSVPESEEAMKSGTEALPLLTLWLALLIGLVVATQLARQRWTRTQVWVVGCAPLLALSWLTTDTAMRLLPNLI